MLEGDSQVQAPATPKEELSRGISGNGRGRLASMRNPCPGLKKSHGTPGEAGGATLAANTGLTGLRCEHQGWMSIYLTSTPL